MWEEAPESMYHSEVDREVVAALFKEASSAWVSKVDEVEADDGAIVLK
jgi:hypothetical protein